MLSYRAIPVMSLRLSSLVYAWTEHSTTESASTQVDPSDPLWLTAGGTVAQTMRTHGTHLQCVPCAIHCLASRWDCLTETVNHRVCWTVDVPAVSMLTAGRTSHLSIRMVGTVL